MISNEVSCRPITGRGASYRARGALLSLCGFLMVWMVASPAQARQSGAVPDAGFEDRVGRVSLHLGEFAASRFPNLLTQDDARFDADARYVVQLDGPIDPERRSALEALGVELFDYVPHFAYVAKLEGVDRGRLAAIEFLSSVFAFPESWKLDVDLGSRTFVSQPRLEVLASGRRPIVVTLFGGAPAEQVVPWLEARGAEVHWIEPVGGNVVVSTTVPEDAVTELAGVPAVQFVEDAPDITLRNNSSRWIVQSNQNGVTPFYDRGIRGEGQVGGILDSRVNVNHCSFFDGAPFGPSHRKILAYNTSTGNSTHGTHVAGTMAGDAGADAHTRGVAYESKFVFDTTPSFTESGIRGRLDLHHAQGARVHSNSWGDDGTTSYNSLARGFDAFSYDFEESLVCLAVTNTSSLRNPENAKNLLAVGASQDSPNQGSHCSGGTGPTADSRRKPEIYAPGCGTNSSNGGGCGTTSLTGTSMACPAVAGTALLVREYFTDGYYPTGAAVPLDGFTPSGALLKATLLNGTVDMTGVSGYPSNREGWGRLLADDAAFFAGDDRKLVVMSDRRNASGLSTGEFEEFPLEVVTASESLRVTLAFTDAPASASTGTGFAAVNDLDLEVVSPGGTTYRGNVFSGGRSVAGGSADFRNNVEQVWLESPATGSWTVRVRAAAVNVGRQGFAVVATGDVTPEEPALRVAIPTVPERVSSFLSTEFDVEITDATETLDTDSPTLHYRYDGGSFSTVPMTLVSGDTWRASLPPADCSDTPEFYVSARGNGGTLVTNPASAPSLAYDADVLDETLWLADDFESDNGWTVENLSLDDGAWERGVPTGGTGVPPSDDDGSGQCFVTGLAVGSDVDGGTTRLQSPELTLADSDAYIEYSLWYFNDRGDDDLEIAVSPNGGRSWIPVATVEADPDGGWERGGFRVSDFVTPTDRIVVRFEAFDDLADSNLEAAVDAVRVVSFGCLDESSVTDCGDGAVNVGCGGREDILTVNGQTGGPERTLSIDRDAALSFVLDEPSAESGDAGDEPACVYFWFAEPQGSDVVTLPKQLGEMCFGPKFLASRPADVTFNAIGFNGKLGAHDAPVAPPVVPDGSTLEFWSLPTGFGMPMSVTVQGLVPDVCTQGTRDFSVTNAIVLRLR